jgi:phosphomevalonate kinase
MRITASAPGKLVLLGEYAVLVGVPALVLAVDRRARVSLSPAAGEAWEIVSPTLGLAAQLEIHAGKVVWLDAPPEKLEWVTALLEALPQPETLSPCRIELDTAPFYLDDEGVSVKLGLGSSAALTVALMGALHRHGELPPPTLEQCVSLHRAIQNGRGSGIDIAASLSGGLSRFQLVGDTHRATPVKLPSGLHWQCVYSGHPTSTREMLAIVNDWRRNHRFRFGHRMRELAKISRRSIDALATRDADAFLTTIRDCSQSLVRFGESAGADIVSREHRAIGALAASSGCVYKSCGAGGGDAGITFAMSEGPLRKFAERAERAGFHVIDLGPDATGLEVETIS